MNQTSAIAASIVIAFVVFITVKGQLPCYLEILGFSTAGQCGSISSAGGGGLSLTSGGGGVSISTPPIGIGGVTVQPPVIRI